MHGQGREKGACFLGHERCIVIFISFDHSLQQRSPCPGQDQEISIYSVDSEIRGLIDTDASGFGLIHITDIDSIAPKNKRESVADYSRYLSVNRSVTR
ncbi:hypothetical protein VMCG_00493 [Cytospora schulzeri]|uniref:Uncharacterized protein n=1 Tax=Cytospora schulzeri TaxID=448051 RepID=A0A423X7Y6_9PEZI|nr:hypothetical protein VMCG_00493 [Valsa malicola]